MWSYKVQEEQEGIKYNQVKDQYITSIGISRDIQCRIRDGITIEANVAEDDKECIVCHNIKLQIEAALAQTTRKRKSA